MFLRQPVNDQLITWTYRDAGSEIRRIASALKRLNLPQGSNIAILSKNCAHWIMADLAIFMAGHVSVPLYPTLSGSAIGEILRHSESRVLFVGKLDNFPAQRSSIPMEVHRISFSLYGEKEGDQWDELLAANLPLEQPEKRLPEEVGTIKYTSGTTGNPKGVMITFGAFHHATSQALKGFDLVNGPYRFFSYLPLSHIAERMLVQMGAIYSGSSIDFSESLEKFAGNLAKAQPTVFLGVPRIWEKFRERIEEKMPKLDRLIRIPVLNALVKMMIRRKLGLSKAKWILTGAAPISVSLLEWFQKIGITIHEAYGMTENLAYSHANLARVKFGSVGEAWPDVTVRLGVDDEIQVKSPAMMTGYYREPALTSQAFTDDGFLKTGDKGVVDRDGFLIITGRVKDQFKTDKGKYIDPAPIELQISSHPDIEQVCVVGSGLPQPIALVVLSMAARNKARDLLSESLADLCGRINELLHAHERIRSAIVLDDAWTIENGLMTPTLKVKRNEVERIYSPRYREWYASSRQVVWARPQE